MADLRIVDAPDLPLEELTEEVKIPTGGKGNYAVKAGDVATFVEQSKDLANKTFVNSSSNGVKTLLDAHKNDKENPHDVTKAQIGLGNVDNTADLDKPVSNSTSSAIITATQGKADKTYVDNQLGLKADKTYVDAQDALKANKDDLGTASEYDVEDLPISNAQKEVNDKNVGTVESIADLIAIQNPKDGQVTDVKGYYKATNFALAQPFKGGDLFYYVALLAQVYNGVTVFNGWVRDTSDKVLTTDDAGLKGDGIDSNQTAKLQAIADAVGDGFTVKFIGDYKVNTSIYFNNKKSLELSSINGGISGDKTNWEWGEKINGTNRRGMFVFKDCPNLDIENLVVKGIQKNIFGSFQDGDSCIQLLNCFNPRIKLNTLTHCFAWAIIGEGCAFPIVEYNVISDVVHQSGINICVGGGKNAKINFNHVTNCGLYGIEFETYTALPDDTFEAFGNVVSDCYAGFTPTGSGVTKGLIIGNTVEKCGYAGIMTQNIYNAKSITILNNTLRQNWRGAVLTNCPNTTFSYNPIHNLATEDLYLKLNPDWFVLKVMSSRTFLIRRGAVVSGSTIYINKIAYSASSVADYIDSTNEFSSTDGGASIDLSLVTVSSDITEQAVLNKHLQRKVNAGDRTETNITILEPSDALVVSNNTLSGARYCIHYNQSNPPATAVKQYIQDNTLLDFGIHAILHDVSTSHVFYNRNKTDSVASGTYNIHSDLIKNGSFATKTNKSIALSSQTETVKVTGRFGSSKSGLIVGAYASFHNATTTGSVAIKLNSGSAIITEDGVGAPVVGRMCAGNAEISKGVNTLEVIDTVGNLAFTQVFVDLLVAE